MVIHKFQRPSGLVAEVTSKAHLPERYEATVEVAVPGVSVYWEILDGEEEVVANGFVSSERKAYFAIYQAALALQVSGLQPAINGRQGHVHKALRLITEPQSAHHRVGWGAFRFSLSMKGASHAQDPSLTLSEPPPPAGCCQAG